MRPGYGTMPTYMAKLGAAARLKASMQPAATEEVLEARTTGVSLVADKGLKEIERALVRMGYEPHTTINKAMYTTTFCKGDRCLELVGWHGTGRFKGGERAVLEFYDSEKGLKPVVSIGVTNEDNVSTDHEKKIITDILTYIKRLH
jgi:hypothetical protein